jgi:hypothetical protein
MVDIDYERNEIGIVVRWCGQYIHKAHMTLHWVGWANYRRFVGGCFLEGSSGDLTQLKHFNVLFLILAL